VTIERADIEAVLPAAVAEERRVPFHLPDHARKGDRHLTLYSALRSLKGKRFSFDAAVACCNIVNQDFDPPLEAKELQYERWWDEPATTQDDAERHADRVRSKAEQKRIDHEADLIVAAETHPQPPLHCLTLGELFARPPVDYLIDQWFPELSLIEMTGATGTYKSFFAIDAGLSIASGQHTFHGQSVTRRGPVIYVAAEGAGAFQYRIRAWCAEHDVDALTVPFFVIARPVNLRDPAFQQQLHALVEQHHPVVIFIDTLSRCTPGAEENSARDMGEVTHFCTELQPTTMAFIHHPPKNDPKGEGRGSGSVLAAVDTEIQFEKQGTALTVTCRKQKDDALPDPLRLTASVVDILDEAGRAMAYESGRPITSLVLRDGLPVDAETEARKKAAEDEAIDLLVLRTMHDYPAATSLRKLRGYAELNQGVVDESVGRILRRGWAQHGERGQPYVVLPAGKRLLEGEI
jgi:hypothetical protein